MKKLALHWQILLGMVLGVVFALVMTKFSWGAEAIGDWIKPFGTIFISALKLIAIPLILAALIKGISDLKDISKLSSMGLRTIFLYVLTTVIAVTIGLGVVTAVNPGGSISEDTRNELVEAYGGEAESKRLAAEDQKNTGPL
ncbi:MAG: dicarboxylate/amino acid:cation symporter, partial [Flavobacteriales bacterium]